MKDRISVIITNFNYAPFLRECVESVLGQALAADEIVIVDNGSTDRSLEIAKEFASAHPDRIRLLQCSRKGQAAAMNDGFRATTGDLVAFLDSDDLWFPDKLLQACRILADPTVVAAQHPLILRTNDSHELRNGPPHPSDLPPEVTLDLYFRRRSTDFFGATSSLVVRRKILDKIFPIDEAWTICADVYLTRPLPIWGKVVTVAESLGVYRVHPNNNWYQSPERKDYCKNFRERVRCADGWLARSGIRRRIRWYLNAGYWRTWARQKMGV